MIGLQIKEGEVTKTIYGLVSLDFCVTFMENISKAINNNLTLHRILYHIPVVSQFNLYLDNSGILANYTGTSTWRNCRDAFTAFCPIFQLIAFVSFSLLLLF